MMVRGILIILLPYMEKNKFLNIPDKRNKIRYSSISVFFNNLLIHLKFYNCSNYY